MSTNDLPRLQSSRRTFLTAGAAAAIGGPAVGAVAAPRPDPEGARGNAAAIAAAVVDLAARNLADALADTLFRRWLAVHAEMDALAEIGGDALPDDALDGHMDQVGAIEREMRSGAPSVTTAGALLLSELRYGSMSLEATIEDAEADDDADLALQILPLLLPALTGSVARVAADLLAHRQRPVRDSLLFRATTEA